MLTSPEQPANPKPPTDSEPNVIVRSTGVESELSVERSPKLATETTANNSFACVPLIVEQRVVGGLTYSFGDQRPFTDDERSFLLALGQLTAQALERARLYEAEHNALARAEVGAASL